MNLAILVFLVVVLAILAFGQSKKIWDIEDTPTVTPSGAIIGKCEVQGRATLAGPYSVHHNFMKSPLMQTDCVWYELIVEEYQRSSNYSSWREVASHSQDEGFYLYDDHGRILVNPKNSKKIISHTIKESKDKNIRLKAWKFFNSPKDHANYHWSQSSDGHYLWNDLIQKWILKDYVSPDGSHYFDAEQNAWHPIPVKDEVDKGLVQSLFKNDWSSGNVRVTENVIYENETIFVHGEVNIPEHSSELIVSSEKKYQPDLFISNKGEEKMVKHLINQRRLLFGLASFFLVITLLVANDQRDSVDFKAYWIAIYAAIFLLLNVFGFAILKLARTYNRFVKLKNQVHKGRATIAVCEKRRHELIPNLIKVLEALIAHERDVMQVVTKLRTMPDNSSKEFLAVTERYPNLKSSENFLYMQRELARTEEKIAMSRSFLNDSVLVMDNLRATIVGMIFSPLFAKEPYWQG